MTKHVWTSLSLCACLFIAAVSGAVGQTESKDKAAAPPVANELRIMLEMASPRGEMLRATSLPKNTVDSVDKALAGTGVAIIDATPKNLASLCAKSKEVGEFTARGGWIMLWGLTPDGLSDFNKLVGVEHLIRPFEMEEVEMPVRADPLMKGVRRSDIFMASGEWSGEPVPAELRATDAWTFVVDYDDIAPFCKLPGPEYWGAKPGEAKYGAPHNPRSMVNGLTYQWRFGFYIRLAEERKEPLQWTMTLPRKEVVNGFSIVQSMQFSEIRKLRLTFDDGGAPVDLSIASTGEQQDFAISNRTARVITLQIAEHMTPKDHQRLLGIMNLWIKVKRSPEFYEKVQPLLNIGVLVKYPMGKGGIILNQMNVPAQEQNQKNAPKKASILTGLLGNLLSSK